MRESMREWSENRMGRETQVKHVRNGRGGDCQGLRKITSFFVSNFPNGMSEVGLWRIFQRWGKVRDVMVPRKRTKDGKRFGFVRFEGVKDYKQMEYQLDKILI